MVAFRPVDNIGGARGFWLADPYWGRGHMTEAVTAIPDFLFCELQIIRPTNLQLSPSRESPWPFIDLL